MAYTSIIPVHRLDRAVDYVRDKAKTTRGPKSLQDAVDYAINRDKTESDCFETGLSCVCETAFEDMRDTVQRWQQTAGVQGYHLVQSFAEGEVTPELAHQIGVELAEQLLQGRFQAVVTTHLNTKHYHNHIVWCSVALDNGRKYTAMPSLITQKCEPVPMRSAENMDFPSLRPKKVNSPPCRITFGWTNRRIVQTGHLWCART